MLSYLKNLAARVADDPGYHIRWGCRQAFGKMGIKISCEMADMVLPAAFSALQIIQPEKFPHLGYYLGIPLSIGFSVAMVQGDYNHHRRRTLEQFREEIAAQTGVALEKVTEAEMRQVAFGDRERGIAANPALQETLVQAREQRNWSFGISTAATLISALVTIGVKSMPVVAGLGGFAPVIVAGAAAGLSYLAVRHVIHYAAEQLFGLEKVTVHDRIYDIHREHEKGRAVSQEKVLSAYLEAHPVINRTLRRTYGNSFDGLGEAEKREVLNELAPQLNLVQLTHDINRGHIRAEELAFAAYGQFSGVARRETPEEIAAEPGFFKPGWEKCIKAIRRWAGKREEQEFEKLASIEGIAPQKPGMIEVETHTPDGKHAMAVRAGRANRGDVRESFVQMVGRDEGKGGEVSFAQSVSRSEGINFSERVEQSRVETGGLGLQG